MLGQELLVYDLQGDSLEICLSFSLRKLKALTPCNVSICCRWTPLMVARSWHRTGLEDILSTQPEGQLEVLPSPYLALPLMSIVKIARWLNFALLHITALAHVVLMAVTLNYNFVLIKLQYVFSVAQWMLHSQQKVFHMSKILFIIWMEYLWEMTKHGRSTSCHSRVFFIHFQIISYDW